MSGSTGRKIAHLPGTRLTPDVVLARTAEKLPRIKALVVIAQFDDDTVGVDWSSMRLSDLCFAERSLGFEVAEVIAGADR